MNTTPKPPGTHTHADGTTHSHVEGAAHAHAAAPLYRGYPATALKSGRVYHGIGVDIPAPGRPMMARLKAAFAEPFRGISADGSVVPGLFPLQRSAVTTASAVQAARAYLARLRRSDFRRLALEPLESPDRYRWTNAFPDWMPAGLWLADLEADERAAALAIIEASLSASGFAQARDAMRINEALGEFINHSRDSICEYGYFFTIFGDPSGTSPWGWRLMGYHLVIYCTFIGDQMVLTPSFVGAEMSVIDAGAFAGVQILQQEQRGGLELAGSLSATQRSQAILYPSMKKADLPAALVGLDGRHQTAAGQDNRMLPYEGIAADALSNGQRELLRNLIELYVSRSPEPYRAQRMAEIERHLPNTRFAWIGDPERVPFYYRVHSPVIIIEFDHHSGVFLANAEPESFHIHTIVRTPNGNDYGHDLLRQHYAAFPHA